MSMHIDSASNPSYSLYSASQASDALQPSTQKNTQVERVPSVSEAESTISLSAAAEVQRVTGVPYSTHVGDKTYATEVQPIGNLYEGNIPSLLGASTIGTSIEQVETRLGNLISFFA